MALVMILYRLLTGFILWNAGRPAYTSGDLPYLMRTWEGWVLIILGFLALVIYTVFDINATILLSEKLLKSEKVNVPVLLRDAVLSLKQFRSIWGALAILYVSLAAPLTGAAFGVSLTSGFTIPNFIMSVIEGKTILYLLYLAGIIALGIVGFLYIFTFDFAILGGQPVPQAMKYSKAVIRKKWKDFLIQYILFSLKWVALYAGIIVIVYFLPVQIMRLLPLGQQAYRTGVIFFSVLTAALFALCFMLVTYYTQMKLTLLYYHYTENELSCQTPEKKRHIWMRIVLAVLLALDAFLSSVAAADFDEFFPVTGHARVVAHRAGGNLANENTVLAFEAAISHGAGGAEIDVQRTKDGYYVVNHDSTFKRCCGDPRKPGEMTLEEIKKLQVRNLSNPLAPTTSVATLEEMLDASKGKIRLYIELKGESADEKMAEDVIAMVRERDMTDETMLISLDYELIDYIETNYPEIHTGYLCYFSFGSLEEMNCDAVLMEEEVATDQNIEKIRGAGKETGVWTVNTWSSMTDFLTSDVDWIITDEVQQAAAVKSVLENEDDAARVLAAVLRAVSL